VMRQSKSGKRSLIQQGGINTGKHWLLDGIMPVDQVAALTV